MTEFKPYPSLTNTYRIKECLEKAEPYKECWWIVTEKIHGSNFSVLLETVNGGVKVSFCSRNRVTGLDFFNAKEAISDEFIDKVVKAYKNTYIDGGATVQIYGELYGEGVQKGVLYPKGRYFKVFDVALSEVGRSRVFMQPDVVQGLFDNAVPVLFVGSLEECLNFANDLDSVVGVQKEGNTMEGVVIRPLVVLTEDNFCVFKNKNEKFSERKAEVKVKVIEDIDLGVLEMVNQNRLNSVTSKEGPFSTIKDMGKYINLMISDILEELKLDGIILTHGQTKALTKCVAEFLKGVLSAF